MSVRHGHSLKDTSAAHTPLPARVTLSQVNIKEMFFGRLQIRGCVADSPPVKNGLLKSPELRHEEGNKQHISKTAIPFEFLFFKFSFLFLPGLLFTLVLLRRRRKAGGLSILGHRGEQKKNKIKTTRRKHPRQKRSTD